MRFTMKGGVLSGETDRKVRAVLKGTFHSPKKRVFTGDGMLALQTDIRNVSGTQTHPGDVWAREYVLLTSSGDEFATARPGYSKDDDPNQMGWPIFRLPHVDHAHVFWGGDEYRLNMDRNQNYTLVSPSLEPVARFWRKGFLGGWTVEAKDSFPADLLCAVYAFCQYLGQENELMVV